MRRLVVLAMFVCATLSTTGCRSPEYAEDELASRIQRLGQEPLDELPTDLGTPVAGDTKDTKYIVSRGDEAIPLLVAALSSTNVRTIGWAAYCLQKLGACSGKSAAEAARGRLLGISAPRQDEFFAIGLVNVYIHSCETGNKAR
jgi:hypothetical protein